MGHAVRSHTKFLTVPAGSAERAGGEVAGGGQPVDVVPDVAGAALLRAAASMKNLGDAAATGSQPFRPALTTAP